MSCDREERIKKLEDRVLTIENRLEIIHSELLKLHANNGENKEFYELYNAWGRAEFMGKGSWQIGDN